VKYCDTLSAQKTELSYKKLVQHRLINYMRQVITKKFQHCIL